MKIPCKQCISLAMCINKTGAGIRKLRCPSIDKYIRHEINKLIENDEDGVFSDQTLESSIFYERSENANMRAYVGFVMEMITDFSIQTELTNPYVDTCIEQIETNKET